ncbi:MAG: hypothetical protein V9E93_00590 [Steroidobacteraceae bacterium]
MMCRPPDAITCSCRRFHSASTAARAAASVGVDLQQLCLEAAAEHDVRAAAGHVGGDRHGARTSGLRHDDRFAVVLLRVQHVVIDALLLQQAREQLRGFHRGGADERRLAALDALADVLDDRFVLVFLGQVHEVRRVVADHRTVRRDHDHFETVDLLELEGLGVGGAGHARQLAVHAEEVLERDRGNRLVLLAHVDAFLRLH